jgi:KDO2-lipid IV(A) lauroyltransferase
MDALVLNFLILLSWLAWIIPWPVWQVTSFSAGLVGMCFRPRHAVLANIRHARSSAPPSALVAWYLATQQIATHFKTIISTLRVGARQPKSSKRLIISGMENLEPYLGQRGIIVVAPHAGPYPTLGLMAVQWLRERGFTGEFAVAARLFRPFRSGALMEWFIERFTRGGVTVIPVAGSPRQLGARLKQVLDANGIVVLFVDEPTPTPSATVPFFDSAIRLPLGPVRLARATGSVIIPCIVTYGKSQRMSLKLGEAIEPSESAEATLAQVAASLEEFVSQHLSQWSMLTPIWADMPTSVRAA